MAQKRGTSLMDVPQQQIRVPSSRKLQIEGRIVALCYNLIHAFTFPYTANVLSAEFTDECL